MTQNRARLLAFLARVTYDLGAAQSAALVVLGDRLGLYRAMAGAGSLTAADLARRTGTSERYVREWLLNQWAGGYLERDAEADVFQLPDEHAEVLAVEGGPLFAGGGFESALALAGVVERLEPAFRTGGGLSARDFDPGFLRGLARTARARYRAHLLDWVRALAAVSARLEAGGAAAEVGCGSGVALLLLAEAYPAARCAGFDADPDIVVQAQAAAVAAGLERVRFEVAEATQLPDGPWDLILSLDALHEMAYPTRVARRVLGALAPDGAWLVAEPPAGDSPELNVGPVGRYLSSLSVLRCLPVARAAGGDGLGALVGETRLRALLSEAGFSRVARLGDLPQALVLAARR